MDAMSMGPGCAACFLPPVLPYEYDERYGVISPVYVFQRFSQSHGTTYLQQRQRQRASRARTDRPCVAKDELRRAELPDLCALLIGGRRAIRLLRSDSAPKQDAARRAGGGVASGAGAPTGSIRSVIWLMGGSMGGEGFLFGFQQQDEVCEQAILSGGPGKRPTPQLGAGSGTVRIRGRTYTSVFGVGGGGVEPKAHSRNAAGLCASRTIVPKIQIQRPRAWASGWTARMPARRS